MIGTIVSVVGGIANTFLSGRNRRQAARDALAAARQSTKDQVMVKREDLNSVRVSGLDHTWKDEFATVVWLSPVILVMIGSILDAFGMPAFKSGMLHGLQWLNQIMDNGPVGIIIMATTGAAIGVSLMKR